MGVLEEEVPLFFPIFLSEWVTYLRIKKKPESILGNCAFAFSKQCPLMRLMLENVKQTYTQDKFTTIGSALLTNCSQELAKVEEVLKIPISTGINVIRQKYISGVPVFTVREQLFQSKSLAGWRETLKSASSIHFSSSGTSDLSVDKTDPLSSAYSLIAPHY